MFKAGNMIFGGQLQYWIVGMVHKLGQYKERHPE